MAAKFSGKDHVVLLTFTVILAFNEAWLRSSSARYTATYPIVDSRKKDVANIITQDEATNSPATTEHKPIASSTSISILSLLLNLRLQGFNRRAIGRVKYVADRIMLATSPVNIMANSALVESN